MKLTTFCLTFCLLLPCFAAPHEVAITFKKADGQLLTGKQTFSVLGPKNYLFRFTLENGILREATPHITFPSKIRGGKLLLEPGYYSLYLGPLWFVSNSDSKVPNQVWHGLAVSSEAKDVTNWDLKVPPVAALQGKILLPDGKPAASCFVEVQSGTKRWMDSLGEPVTASKMLVERDKIAHGAQHAYSATRTDKDGNFTLNSLVPANYALDIYEPTSKIWFTIPFAPALKGDAEKGEPTQLGSWTVPKNGWDWLFDAKAEHGAVESKFIGQGKVTIENGVLRLGVGDDMTGLNWPDLEKEKLPRQNYEISFDARRVEGVDFFAGLTFPWGDKPISWIVGGWGGTVVGLSNVNGFSAVENETTKTMEFEDERWYRLRLRVSKAKIEAWIDEEKVIDLPTMDKEFTIRWSVEPSLPLGFATWKTGGELRDIRIRSLEKDEIAAIEKSAQE